jgi:hypothetical protein
VQVTGRWSGVVRPRCVHVSCGVGGGTPPPTRLWRLFCSARPSPHDPRVAGERWRSARTCCPAVRRRSVSGVTPLFDDFRYRRPRTRDEEDGGFLDRSGDRGCARW